jgi:lipoate-protein ligase B
MFVQLLQLGRVGYAQGLEVQRRVVEARKAGRIGDVLLLLEHEPVITLGRNASRKNVLVSDAWLAARGVELHEVNRGGDVTYHGPGQLVGYPIVDLRGEWPGKRGPFLGPVDLVRLLEETLIRTCGEFGVMAKRVKGCTGVWTFGGGDEVRGSRFEVRGGENGQGSGVGGEEEQMRGSLHSALLHPSERARRGPRLLHPSERARRGPRLRAPVEMTPSQGGDYGSGRDDALLGGDSASGGMREKKLAAIGVHVSQGVTSHGFALNVTTDLRDFEWIVPCGIRDRGVTSLELEAAGEVTMEGAGNAAARCFGRVFARQMVACGSLEELLAGAKA